MPPLPLWSEDRPSILVIACSDGRLETQTDRFLKEELGIRGYDRYYIPGGPGALADSGFEYSRMDAHRKDCRFLHCRGGLPVSGVAGLYSFIGLRLAVRVQRGADLRVLEGEDRGGEQGGVDRPRLSNCERADGNSGGHLHHREERIQTFERCGFH